MAADDPPLASDADAARLFAGPGEMRARCRAHDWAATPLGPVAGWPPSLRTTVDLCLGSAAASFVWWGPELVQLHNDAALALVRAQHPAALGVPARLAWADVWPVVGPLLEEVVRTGEAVRRDDLPMVPDRGAPGTTPGTTPGTAWFTFSYGPARDETGAVAGVFCTGLETTDRQHAAAVLRESEERQAFLLRLSDALRACPDEPSIKQQTVTMLGDHLRLDRCYVSEVFEEDDYSTVGPEHVRPGLPSMVGRYRLSDYPETQRQMATQPLVIDDADDDPRFSDEQKAMLALVPQRALLVAPLRKGPRRIVWALAGAMATPRHWTDGERELLEETAERTWAAVERARAEDALRESEEQFRRSIEEAPIPIIMHAEDGEVLQVSRTWTELTGYALSDVPTFDAWLTRAYGEGADAVREHVHALFAGSRRTMSIDFPVRTRDGELRHWSFSASAPGTLRDGRRFVVGMALDVTERQRAEEAQRASEARYRTLVESVRDHAIFLLDAQGVVTEWPSGAERVTGFPAAEAVGQPLARFYAPEEAAAGLPAAHLAEAAAAGHGEWEGWRLRRDGTRFWVNEIATAVRDAEGRLVGFTKVSRDLTEHRLAEEAAEARRLAAARDELRRALAAAEEAERRRLARELHDQLGQELTAFRLGLDDAARLAAAHDPALARPNAPLAPRLAQLQALAAHVTAGARAIALELRPPELDDVGLEGALASCVREWAARYGIAADVAVAGLAGRELPGDVSSALYRITQEALTNVAKHAHATQVSVIVEQSDGEVRLIVEDDGRGFDVEATGARARREGRLGLAGMRERAALVGGTLTVEASLGAGTAVYARLPLADPAAGGEHLPDEESIP